MSTLNMSTQRRLPPVLRRSLGVLCLGLALSLTGEAQAAPLSLSEAAEVVQARHGGQVLAIQPARSDGKDAFRVKLLQSSGVVRLILIDAKDGSPLPYERKNKP